MHSPQLLFAFSPQRDKPVTYVATTRFCMNSNVIYSTLAFPKVGGHSSSLQYLSSESSLIHSHHGYPPHFLRGFRITISEHRNMLGPTEDSDQNFLPLIERSPVPLTHPTLSNNLQNLSTLCPTSSIPLKSPGSPKRLIPKSNIFVISTTNPSILSISLITKLQRPLSNRWLRG